MTKMSRWIALLALLAPVAAFGQTTTTTTTTLPNPVVSMASLPSCQGGGCIPRLDAALTQLRAPKLYAVATGGGITAGVFANKTLADASANTLKLYAYIAGEEGNNLRVTTKRVTRADGTVGFDVTILRLAVVLETFKSLSMVETDRRYVVKVLNDGIPGAGPSQYVRVIDLQSVTADPRPSDVTAQAFTTGANEFTVTGVHRGDRIAAAILADASAAPAATDFIVSTDDKVVSKNSVASSKVLVLLVYPAGG